MTYESVIFFCTNVKSELMAIQQFSLAFDLTAIKAGARHLGLETDQECVYVLSIKQCLLVKKIEKC